MNKTCSKYKEMLKKKGGLAANRASTSGKQTNQVGVAEKAVEESCDVLLVNPSRGNGRFSDDWLLDSGAYTTCAQGKSGSAYVSILKEAQS